MSKTALLFPGQASQYVGMGKDLFESSAEVRRLYELTSDCIGENIAELSFNGPAERLKETRFTQPAILLHSLSVLNILGEECPSFDFAAGHSLGEYGALVAVGALSPESAIKSVVERAKLMDDACRQNPGTMAVAMGLSAEDIHRICGRAAEASIIVEANFNSPAQIVVSGSLEGIDRFIELAKEAGAKRAMILEVGGAFHSPLMEPARKGLERYLQTIEIHSPRVPIIANVTGEAATDPTEIRNLLIQQVTAPVRWSQTMAYLKRNNVTKVFEIGPGKVLSGLAKREMQVEQLINLDTLADIKSFAPLAV
ncbi:MAG: ACP S-malonyltransferase [candidate division Zixibacteria bacterium]|nr:ACP S-malonyltransferase [candidate division Zixibacteria bacterium]